MTKPAWTSEDQLIMQVRELLKATEPRPEPVRPHENQYGVKLVDCPACGNDMRKETYNYHYTYYHGEKFWKEKQLIKLLRNE